MQSQNEFEKIGIKNHACYHFHYEMRVIDINSKYILLHGKKMKIF